MVKLQVENYKKIKIKVNNLNLNLNYVVNHLFYVKIN